MQCPSRFTRSVLAVTGMLLWMMVTGALAGGIRSPVVAGLWYPSDRLELQRLIAHLTQKAENTPLNLPAAKRLRALVLPHAGFTYSGWTAAHAGRVLKPNQFDSVILMGPDHRIGFRNAAVSDVDGYRTPLGIARIHADAEKLRLNPSLFQAVPASDRQEHSLEAVLPFLQTFLGELRFVPLVFGPAEIGEMADSIEPLLNEKTLVVVSTDLSHFLPYERAVSRDRETIRLILAGATRQLQGRDNCACGKTPLLVLLELARRNGWHPHLLHYSNSGDTGAGHDRVVGYTAVAFYEELEAMNQKEPEDNQFSPEEGRLLIALARRAIAERLGIRADITQEKAAAKVLELPCFKARCGTFVTLKKDDRLRGCIGTIMPVKSVAESVRENALSAAFRDPRFPPLKEDEFHRLHISVSILTEPKPLQYEECSELPNKLRTNVDGVILRKGEAGATFLPQVWEQLPDAEQFLSHLCSKAGLSHDEWRKSKLEVSTYQVQYFEETP